MKTELFPHQPEIQTLGSSLQYQFPSYVLDMFYEVVNR